MNRQKLVTIERWLKSWNTEYNFKWNQPYLSLGAAQILWIRPRVKLSARSNIEIEFESTMFELRLDEAQFF